MTQEMLTRYDGHFAAVAVSKDETRYYMMHCECVEHDGKKCLVGTDGRRLHIWPIDRAPADFETGIGYKPIKVTKKQVDFVKLNPADYQFPNFKRVIPSDMYDAGDYAPIEIEIPADVKKNADTFHQACTQIARFLPSDKGINYDFLKDLAGDTWSVNLDREENAVLLSAGAGKIAVIALMQHEKPERGGVYQAPAAEVSKDQSEPENAVQVFRYHLSRQNAVTAMVEQENEPESEPAPDCEHSRIIERINPDTGALENYCQDCRQSFKPPSEPAEPTPESAVNEIWHPRNALTS